MIEENDDVVRLHQLLDESLDRLSQVIHLINEIQHESRQEAITNISHAVGHIWNAKRYLPEDPRESPDEAPEPLPPLTDEQLDLVRRLSNEQVRKIDDALVSNASHQWRKVARIVMSTMMELNDSLGLPDIYYAQRVLSLVDAGRLEAQGDLKYLRFSEVRLPS